MMKSDSDPIIAVATALGRGGIGIVRLSFPSTLNEVILKSLFGDRQVEPRYATLINYKNCHGEQLDQLIALFFPAPHSYTGESVIELQAHGGGVLLQMIVRDCLERLAPYGLRFAEAGEFTQRAFLNGRIDLLQAEAVTDVIDAMSSEAAKVAVKSLSGKFSEVISNIGTRLDELRAFIEATLDFPEEEVEHLQSGHIEERLHQIQNDFHQVYRNAQQGSVLRDGLTVAIIGSPNVGKSSLMNCLAEEDIAIVTDVPGTTRDKIECWITLAGVPIKVVDTAGIRQTDDIVENKGIERALGEIRKADVVLHLRDASGQVEQDPALLAKVLSEVKEGTPLLTVWNKSDLCWREDVGNDLRISVKTNEGIDALREYLIKLAGVESTTEGIYMARERQLKCLIETNKHIDRALESLQHQLGLEIVAEELRLAGRRLGEILGETVSDDILGLIFSKFCIGK